MRHRHVHGARGGGASGFFDVPGSEHEHENYYGHNGSVENLHACTRDGEGEVTVMKTTNIVSIILRIYSYIRLNLNNNNWSIFFVRSTSNIHIGL